MFVVVRRVVQQQRLVDVEDRERLRGRRAVLADADELARDGLE